MPTYFLMAYCNQENGLKTSRKCLYFPIFILISLKLLKFCLYKHYIFCFELCCYKDACCLVSCLVILFIKRKSPIFRLPTTFDSFQNKTKAAEHPSIIYELIFIGDLTINKRLFSSRRSASKSTWNCEIT